MVRRSAPLLILLAGAAPFLLADALPSAGAGVSAFVGGLAAGLCALAPLRGREEPVAAGVFGAGALLLAIALNTRDVGAAATPVEALFAAAAGLLFGFAFAVPAAVVALPLVVGGIDLAAVLARGGGDDEAAPGALDDPDLLTLDLPRWGGGGDVAALGLLDAVFVALFAAWALRYALRPRIVVPLLVVTLGAAAALGVALDTAVPALPLLALAFLLPVADRLPALVRSDG